MGPRRHWLWKISNSFCLLLPEISSISAVLIVRERLYDSSHDFLGRLSDSKPNFLLGSVRDWAWLASPGKNWDIGMGRESLPKVHMCRHAGTHIAHRKHRHTRTHTTHRLSPFFLFPFVSYIPICQSFSGSSHHHKGYLVLVFITSPNVQTECIVKSVLRSNPPQTLHSICSVTEHNLLSVHSARHGPRITPKLHTRSIPVINASIRV